MPSVFYSYAQTAAQEFNQLFRESNVFDNPKNWRDIARMVRYLGSQDSLILDYFAGSGTTGHAVINLNREDGGNRKYILVEMGEYFGTVLKPRILKAIYSSDWKDGKPVSREGVSQIVKVLTLESYEDTLNNLELRRDPARQTLFDAEPAAHADYLVSYMLDLDTQGSSSLLNLRGLERPFDYGLNITQGGETVRRAVDLVETFNYLLGLCVERVLAEGGIRTVEGTDPSGARVLVIWRTLADCDDAALSAFFLARRAHTDDARYDRIYVNGDNTLARHRREGDGWQLLPTEEAFKRLMFDTPED